MASKKTISQATSCQAQTKLDPKLLAYCAAASGALLTAPPADAAVVYSGVKDQSVASSGVSVDLDTDGVNDFNFKIFSYNILHGSISFSQFFEVYIKPFATNAFAGNPLPFKITTGNIIPSSLPWNLNTGILNQLARPVQNTNSCRYLSVGNFVNTTGYIGVKFDISSQRHYGWIQYTGTNAPSRPFCYARRASGKILDWAYESTPNYTIQAGQTTGSGSPVDTDADGFADDVDNCPSVANSLQLDADGDTTGDSCDSTPGCGGCGLPLCEEQIGTYADTDGDNWADVLDNCDTAYNPNQKDADHDHIGDCCDTEPGCGGCGQPACDTVCSK